MEENSAKHQLPLIKYAQLRFRYERYIFYFPFIENDIGHTGNFNDAIKMSH